MNFSTGRVSRRYTIEEQLGQGGMGVVYKATDRLTGKPVALKQVLKNADAKLLNSLTSGVDLRLALTQEFNALASLRHPNIIGVLDYGFDTEKQPYFTMEFLAKSSTILDEGCKQPFQQQLDFVMQVLQALVYIHRRGIIHRDLKPSNVLVTEGQVRVLDFGLSIVAGQNQSPNSALGTLAYMAPETLIDGSVSAVSDLYTVGIMAYELFTGQHPFDTDSITRLIDQIQTEPPDLSHPSLDQRLVPFLAQLVAKDPEDRFTSANAAIDCLRECVGELLPPEDEAIRESFLQAAQFVGRKQEFEMLSESLITLIGGMGSSWLIAGESGVGKSRLLNELRTLALVRGVSVLRGQAVSEGSSPFQLWRDVLRWLVLLGDLSDLEASILKSVVPDISVLLARPVNDAPEIEPQAAQTRLFSTIEQILRRQNRPLLIILEDLHWVGTESLALLTWLVRADLQMMMVASYRDEEKPDLPLSLPKMRQIKLNRLSKENIAELGASMLGPSAKVPGLVDLLHRETEGNPFFLVEVVRALAEEAGQLDRVHGITLPEKVLAGGVMNVIMRRLRNIPASDRPYLELAAVAGRQLDLDLLRISNDGFDLDNWLTRCANTALLELQDGRWRFTHDKLREQLLTELSTEHRKQYHREVARGIEHLHTDLFFHAVTLAYHWRNAESPENELKYTVIAAEQELRNDANKEAIEFYSRALELDTLLASNSRKADSSLRRAQWHRAMGSAYYSIGLMDESRNHYRQSLILLGQPEPQSTTGQAAHLAFELTRQIYHRVRPGWAAWQRQMTTMRPIEKARAFRELAETYYYQNLVLPAISASFSSLNLSENLPASAELAQSYADTCIMSGFLSLHGLAARYSQLAIDTAKKLDDEMSLIHTILRVSLYWLSVGKWDIAKEMLETTVAAYDKINDRFGKSRSMGPLATILRFQGYLQESRNLFEEYLADVKQRNDVYLHNLAASGLATVELRLGETDKALHNLEEALAVLKTTPNMGGEIRAYGLLAVTYLRQQKISQAREAAEAAINRINSVAIPSVYAVTDGYVSTAEAMISLWELSTSQEDRDKYAELSKQACVALKKIARRFSICNTNFFFCEGRMAWLNGQHEEAYKLWEKSIEEARKRAMPYEEAMAHEEIARHLEAEKEDSKRSAHYQQAIRLYKQTGAAYDQFRLASLI